MRKRDLALLATLHQLPVGVRTIPTPPGVEIEVPRPFTGVPFPAPPTVQIPTPTTQLPRPPKRPK